jgi:SWI/SNF-related matrix-associated actin-dependent regulator of chromatin subfamily A-like protein 1
MGLWPHQAEGVEHAIRHRKVAWAHDTGTGKTRTAIELANAIDADRILVICPTIAVEHWRLQIDQWFRRDRSVSIVRSAASDLVSASTLIVTYSLLSTNPKLAARLTQYQFDLVIIDEAHALKEEESARSEAVYGFETGLGVVRNAPYVVLLSATLMPNHPGELWTHLHSLRPELLKEPGHDSFLERYCIIKTIWRGSTPFERVVGAKKGAPATDLKRRLSTFVHRVRKRDVQKDLPPFTLDVWPVHIDDLNVPEDLLREWRTAEAALLRSIGSATGEEALALARASPHSATQRRLTGVIKVAAMTAILAAELEEPGKKVISFAYHRGVLEALARRFSGHGVVTIDGRTPPEQRFMLVRDFQINPKIRLFNGQIVTAGESIDLTASSTVWLMEQDWSPKTIMQAIGRAHRPGQTETVTVRMLTLEGSIDTALARTLKRKTEDIEMIMEST